MLLVQGGETYEQTLKELCNKQSYTVLYFYPKDSTPGCTIESKGFQSLQDSFGEINTQVVGVSKDSVKSHCRFAAAFDLLFPLVVDTDLVLHEKFSTIGEKKMFGKTYKGTIRSTFVLNNEGEIIKERRNVKVKNHADKVLEYCKTL